MAGIRSIHRGSLAKGFATGSSAPIRVDDTSNTLMVNGVGSGTTEIPIIGDGAETVITTRVLTAVDNGKTFFLGLVGGFTITLPLISTLAAGWRCKFFVSVAPTTAYIIIANTTDLDKMSGAVYEASGGVGDAETAATADQMNFVASTAVIGDYAEVITDGTSWFGSMHVNAAGGGTFTG